MMMKAAPAAPLIMIEPDLVLELLVVAFNAPANHRQPHEALERGGGRHGREPILARLRLVLRPLDQEPFFRARVRELPIAMRRTDAHGGKPRDHRSPGALAPAHELPRARIERPRQLTHGEGPMTCVAVQPRLRTAAGRAPRRQNWTPSGRPDAGVAAHADDVREAAGGQALAKLRHHPIT